MEIKLISKGTLTTLDMVFVILEADMFTIFQSDVSEKHNLLHIKLSYRMSQNFNIRLFTHILLVHKVIT